MIGRRRPTEAEIQKLSQALIQGAGVPSPDYRGCLEALIALILAVEPQKRGGRRRTRTPERYRKLLELMEQLKATEQRALGREPTDKECVEALVRIAKRQKRELLRKPKTILNMVSEARKRAPK